MAPTPPPPDPATCLEQCRVNSCKLSVYYDGKDEKARVAEELNCAEVNANDARHCKALHEQCAAALAARRRPAAP